MDFDLSSDQIALRDGLRSLLKARFDGERVRSGFDRSMFDELDAAGVFSLRADGFGWADAAVVFEELGRGIIPGPHVWSFLAHGLVDPTTDSVVGGVEPGPTILVEHPDTLDSIVVLDTQEIRLVGRPDLALEPVDRPLDPLTPVARARGLPSGETIGDPADAARWRRGGAVLTAALLVGLAARATDMAVAHASTREQFGRVIGGFQAVKHLCADMAVRAELARVATHAAALHLDGADLGDAAAARRAISGAKVLAGAAAIANGRAAMQIHGGMGFTWEADVHLVLKRAWVLETHFGSADRHAWSIPTSVAEAS